MKLNGRYFDAARGQLNFNQNICFVSEAAVSLETQPLRWLETYSLLTIYMFRSLTLRCHGDSAAAVAGNIHTCCPHVVWSLTLRCRGRLSRCGLKTYTHICSRMVRSLMLRCLGRLSRCGGWKHIHIWFAYVSISDAAVPWETQPLRWLKTYTHVVRICFGL